MENNYTVVVSHFIKQDKKEDFEQALKQVIEKAKTYKGYEGIETIQVNNTEGNKYILLVRFNTQENYQAWATSNTRKTWSQQLKNYHIKNSKVRYQEGLEFWFSLPQMPVAQPPKKWKMAILTWMVIYPMVLLLSNLAAIYMDFAPLFLRMLLVSMLLVSLMTYFIMPKITTLFAFWIYKKQ